MKRILTVPICILLSFCACAVPCGAERSSYSWYCKHVKDHLQPSVDSQLSFVEELDGYFIDRNHTEHTADDKVVYLTFDAGYENGNVRRVLDVLKEEEVTGAFFILGGLVRHYPDLVRRMADEGHLVCNHTLRHKDMSQADDAAFLDELQSLENLYREQTGREMALYYRPPEGRFSRENLECAKKNGYKTIFWSFAYPDWDNDKQMSYDKAKKIIMENIHNGEVMLLHPTSSTNAAILGEVIRELKAEGFRFGTLDELTLKER